MGALDLITTHGARGEITTVTVPEWIDAGVPLVIHYRKVRLSDVSEALRRAKGDQVRQNVELFVMVAQNPDGTPMFKQLDTLKLMEGADPAVLGRVMTEMGIVQTATPDDIEKN